jgi:ABC-2 type transport system ATP-binding protein
VGLLTEQPGFYDPLAARYNLVHFARLYGLGRHEADRRAKELLGRFDLANKADAPFGSLSRGMKQKLAIARALMHRPDIVLLDEPTVGLDPEATREVRAIIGELAAEGRTVILCTHHLDEVERLCGRAAFLAGRLVGVHDVAGAAAADRRVVLQLEPPVDGVAGVVGGHPAVAASRLEGGALHLELAEGGAVADVVAAAVGAGGRVQAVVPARHALEEAYLALLAEARRTGLVP